MERGVARLRFRRRAQTERDRVDIINPAVDRSDPLAQRPPGLRLWREQRDSDSTPEINPSLCDHASSGIDRRDDPTERFAVVRLQREARRTEASRAR
jgi:hypothetical protein